MNLKTLLSVPLSLALFACGGTMDSDNANGSGVGYKPSTLSISIAHDPSSGNGQGQGADRPASMDELTEAIVTVREVSVHTAGGGWVTVTDTPSVVDLLHLADHSVELGFAEMPQGKITQIRLLVEEGADSYVTTNDGQQVYMEVPSGIQTGVKIKGAWTIGACENLSITVNLDRNKAIWVHPANDGRYIFRPVIHAARGDSEPIDDCDPNANPNDPNNPAATDPNNPIDGSDPNLPGDIDDPNNPLDPNDPANTGSDPSDPTASGGDPNGGTTGSTDPGSGDATGGDPSGTTDPNSGGGLDTPNDGSGGTGGTDPASGSGTDGTPDGSSSTDGSSDGTGSSSNPDGSTTDTPSDPNDV